ncbi:MAG: endonuclease III [Planctomycetota bacterium]|nr:endonuclease III [Planctomycetota bacterium]
MKKGERADYILSELKRLYPDPAVPLDHFDTYSLLVAVLLSAQTTDKMVNQVTPDLWKLGKTPAEMAKRKPSEIREAIKRCGLSPQKSIAIQKLSEILVQEYDGKVPDSLEELEKLPGVGHKTASVVMCQAFGQNAFPVDTHIHRLAQRWGLTSGASVVQTERDLKKLFPEESWNKLHLQIIYYGREHCTARGCDGTICPICKALYPRRKTPVETRK